MKIMHVIDLSEKNNDKRQLPLYFQLWDCD